MRVISGTARGLKLTSPPGLDTRPTLDRVKEALFSMLMPELRDAEILDLFAGSGALGVEALSRGGRRAVFVDSSPLARAAIAKNLQSATLEARAEVVSGDALKYLASRKEPFDIIFLDPPYGGGLYEKALALIARGRLLSSGGVIAVEWDAEVEAPAFPDCYVRERDRHYGRVNITLLRHSGGEVHGG